jgi:hypothetical protein
MVLLYPSPAAAQTGFLKAQAHQQARHPGTGLAAGNGSLATEWVAEAATVGWGELRGRAPTPAPGAYTASASRSQVQARISRCGTDSTTG